MKTLDESLTEQTVWSGDYRGIRFSIKCTTVSEVVREDREAWTFYLHLPVKQIPAEYAESLVLTASVDERGRINYGYSDSGLAGLDWHGGITFYKVHYMPDGSPSVVEAGCDYQHYNDEHCTYSITGVLQDVERCIDSLWDGLPDLLLRCDWDGSYHHASEMTDIGGSLYGPAALTEEWVQNRIARLSEVTA